jgi:low temperature requirement protein LtrA
MAAYQSADDFASTKTVYAQLSTHFFCAAHAFLGPEYLVRPLQHPWMCRLSHQHSRAFFTRISPTVARSVGHLTASGISPDCRKAPIFWDLSLMISAEIADI